MNRFGLIINILVFLFLNPVLLSAQLSAPGASGSNKTSYPVFSGIDSIYVFCTTSEVPPVAVLQATTGLTGTKTFTLDKYDPRTASFEFLRSEPVDGFSMEYTGLEDGCYRVTITLGATTEVYRAWVFNNWFTAEGTVTESDCDGFIMEGSYSTAELKYYDLTDNTELYVPKNVQMQWKLEDEVISTNQTKPISDPPTQNTDYTFRVFDQYSCEANATVTYTSIVTKAKFSVDFGEQNDNIQTGLEAPLTVNFINQSENGDEYEWFFFYDLDYLARNLNGSTNPEDSIMQYAINENPTYVYENTGTYMVKLVSKKINQSLNLVCVDTAYMEDYIVIDSAFIEVPNVFTPNGDGNNDLFVVKFFSMQSLNISIFNRWGQRIHFWKSNDVRGFENTYVETVWDGRLMGGRFASPGVYYYVAEGKGRDGTNKRANGFFHLFRGSD